MSVADCGLIIFLRNPERGKVKTRLAKSLGEDIALQIYKELSGVTLSLVPLLPMEVYLFYEGGLPDSSERISSAHYMEQSEGSLGDKVLHAFEMILSNHSKAIIIGSDCPYIKADDIMHAGVFLETSDIVIGPSKDGGYYLLGCKKLIPELFRDIEWSTDAVLTQTLERIHALQMSSHQLRTLDDIDVEEDWLRYKSNA